MIQPASLFPVSNQQTTGQTGNQPAGVGAAQVSKQFASFLNDAMVQLNDAQVQVDQLNQKFVTGQLQDIHSLIIASEKAALGLELTVQVRNKVIEAYQEIMRTQV